jgi:hypothetical protein
MKLYTDFSQPIAKSHGIVSSPSLLDLAFHVQTSLFLETLYSHPQYSFYYLPILPSLPAPTPGIYFVSFAGDGGSFSLFIPSFLNLRL